MNIIEVKDLSFSYDKAQVLSSLNFEIKKNDFVCIVGNNGSGKSTLLKILIGQLKNYKGEISLFGIEQKAFQNWEKIGYVPQIERDTTTNFPISVREMILLNLYKEFNILNLPKKRHFRMVNDVITAFNLTEFADKNFNELSGGQKQRVMIAKAMVHNPDVLIFDEPTVGVDKESKKIFFDLIDHLHTHHNITIILVTHELEIDNKQNIRKLELKDNEIRELCLN